MSTKTVLSLWQERQLQLSSTTLSFGCPVLDEELGGFPLRGITELSAPAGCGKTQLSMQLALQAIADTENNDVLGGVAILSCGEGLYPIKRLSQLAYVYEKKSQHLKTKDFLLNVHIEECKNSEEAMETLMKRLPEMCQSKHLRLLIIDSLAGLIRFEYDSKSSDDMKERTAFIFQLAKQLKWLSDIFKIGVLVINQVTAGSFEQSLHSHESIPALGLAWETCINARFSIQRMSSTRQYFTNSEVEAAEGLFGEQHCGNEEEGGDQQQKVIHVGRRKLKLVFSPSHAPAECCFEIRNDGISASL